MVDVSLCFVVRGYLVLGILFHYRFKEEHCVLMSGRVCVRRRALQTLAYPLPWLSLGTGYWSRKLQLGFVSNHTD